MRCLRKQPLLRYFALVENCSPQAHDGQQAMKRLALAAPRETPAARVVLAPLRRDAVIGRDSNNEFGRKAVWSAPWQ